MKNLSITALVILGVLAAVILSASYSRTDKPQAYDPSVYMSADLASDDYIDDLLYDCEGNLLMHARYQDVDGQMVGVRKEVFTYSEHRIKSHKAFRWYCGGWQPATAD